MRLGCPTSSPCWWGALPLTPQRAAVLRGGADITSFPGSLPTLDAKSLLLSSRQLVAFLLLSVSVSLAIPLT